MTLGKYLFFIRYVICRFFFHFFLLFSLSTLEGSEQNSFHLCRTLGVIHKQQSLQLGTLSPSSTLGHAPPWAQAAA